MEKLPPHLKKYIVDQKDYHYSAKEHAVWRHILRQLKSFLKIHAHESYLKGLEATGITIDKIPSISEISQHLEKFGWRALPVSGFIPPAAFMELQSLSILPIAAEIRSLEHLSYTPAPDIVHEAAGHAPILANSEFAHYLKQYSMVAKKSILSSEDLDVYEAIRILSDIKEDPSSTSNEIIKAEKNLQETLSQVTYTSEAAELGRMNWWTAEYGLIGDLANPKIFGAGLLSSVSESKHCLSHKVKKIPLTLDCLTFNYDITEPQPQLFVSPSFKHLENVLNQMADKMAFKVGGVVGLKKALQAKTVNSVVLDSGLQISGIVQEFNSDKTINYLKFQGPSQLSYNDQEIPGHDKFNHSQGFSTILGKIAGISKSSFLFLDDEWTELGLLTGNNVTLKFESGHILVGTYISRTVKDNKTLLLSFKNVTLKIDDQILFKPEWGIFDLALGENVVSVFGGPADRVNFGDDKDFVVKRVKKKLLSDRDKKIHDIYEEVRKIRDSFLNPTNSFNNLKNLYVEIQALDTSDWLLILEIFEVLSIYEEALCSISNFTDFKSEVKNKLEQFLISSPSLRETLTRGIELAAISNV